MNTSLHHFSAYVGCILLLVLITGCRTYGGRGSEEEMLEQIQQTTRLFAEDLERTRTDLAQLERAATRNPALAEYAAAFAEVVSLHEKTVVAHRAVVEDLAMSRDYRDLHRAYGAIITDERVVRDYYAATIDGLRRRVEVDTVQVQSSMSRYQAVPPYYRRIEHDLQQRALSELLNTGSATPDTAQAGPPSAPPAASDSTAPAAEPLTE